MKMISQVYDYNEKMCIPDILFSPLSGVTLTEGLFYDVFENNKRFLHKLDMGAMMYWFDVKTGTPTDSEPYRGHFEDNLKGSTLSMFLMGAGNILRWCDDDALREKVHILMERLRTAAEDDGFLMPVDKRDFAYREYPHYVRIWLTYALTAVGISCEEDAFSLLRRWQDWFNNCPDLPVIQYLELAFQGIVASTSMYATPIGTREDIEVTIDTYEERWRLAQFMRRERDAVHIRRQPGAEPHAHGSELEGIEGYLDLYRATGRNYYYHAVIGAHELYKRDWQHVGGGIVMCEGMPDNYPGCNWLDGKNHYNELCCTSFWLYLNLRLHRLFPDREDYLSEVEKSLYNVAIANQDGGEGIRYFAFLDGKKQESGLVHCCCGVGVRIFGSLPEYVFSVSREAVSINLYTHAMLDWTFGRENAPVRIRLDSDLPYADEARIGLEMRAPSSFALRLRIPQWVDGRVEILCNGKKLAEGVPGTIVTLKREWHDNDVLTYTLPQKFRLTAYRGADECADKRFTRFYIERGPVLYAVCGESRDHALNIGWSREDFEKWLRPVEDKPLHYDIAMHEGYTLRPYFEVDGDCEFTCCPVMN